MRELRARLNGPIMVRRGSTVRVRQRAPAKAPHTRGFHFLDLLHLVQFAQVWNRFWNTQTKKPLVLSSSVTTNLVEVRCSSCGASFTTRSTAEAIAVDVCSN